MQEKYVRPYPLNPFVFCEKSLKIPKGGNHNPYIEEEYNGQKKKDKSTNNDLQYIHIKLKIE
jgi:hypothetical protein